MVISVTSLTCAIAATVLVTLAGILPHECDRCTDEHFYFQIDKSSLINIMGTYFLKLFIPNYVFIWCSYNENIYNFSMVRQWMDFRWFWLLWLPSTTLSSLLSFQLKIVQTGKSKMISIHLCSSADDTNGLHTIFNQRKLFQEK